MSGGGALTQLISTGMQDAYLETSVPNYLSCTGATQNSVVNLPMNQSGLSSTIITSQQDTCLSSPSDHGHDTNNRGFCPIDDYL